MDYSDWLGNGGEEEAVECFLEKYGRDIDLMYLALAYAGAHDCRGLSVDEILEATVRSDKGWARQLDEFMESAYESYLSNLGDRYDINEDR